MQMNDQLRRELTEALAEHLFDNSEKRPFGGTWEQLAQDAMEFIYGEQEQEADDVADDQNGPGCRCGSGGCAGDDHDPAGITLLGVVDPPTMGDLRTLEELRSRFVYVADHQSVTAVPDPESGSGNGPKAP